MFSFVYTTMISSYKKTIVIYALLLFISCRQDNERICYAYHLVVLVFFSNDFLEMLNTKNIQSCFCIFKVYRWLTQHFFWNVIGFSLMQICISLNVVDFVLHHVCRIQRDHCVLDRSHSSLMVRYAQRINRYVIQHFLKFLL